MSISGDSKRGKNGGMRQWGNGSFSSMSYTHRRRNRGGTGGTDGTCPPTFEKLECPFKAYSVALFCQPYN